MKRIFIIVIAMLVTLPAFSQKKEEMVNRINTLQTRLDSSNRAIQTSIYQQGSELGNRIGNMESKLSEQAEALKAQSALVERLGKQVGALLEENEMLKKGLDSLKQNIGSNNCSGPIITELDSIYDVMRHYGEAVTIDGRSAYVLHPETTLPLMVKFYSDDYQKIFYEKELITLTKSHYAIGDIIHISAYDLYLKKTDQGYKIDWEASVGYNPVTMDHYFAKHMTTTTRVRATLKDLRNRDEYYYNIYVNGKFCFLPKGTAAEREIVNLMSDGKIHQAIIEVRGEVDDEGEFSVDLVKFIKKGWVE